MTKQHQDKTKEQLLEISEKLEHVEQNIKDHRKSIHQIETSNTWKASKLYRRVKQLLANNEQVEKAALEAIIVELESALYEAEEQIDSLQLKNTDQTTLAIQQHILEMKQQGKLIASLDTFIHDKVQRQQNYRDALVYAARLYMQAETEEKQLVYEKVLTSLTIEEIPEFIIRAGLEEDGIPLHHTSSFRGSLNMRMRKKQMQTSLPEWPLDDKQTAYRFVEGLHIPTPHIDEQTYTVATIPFQEEVVVKPADGAGARGVYIAYSTDHIFDVKAAKTLSSWNELIEHMQKDLQTGAVEEDAWLLEQLIVENKITKAPARDIKFYCFYGRVGMILEIKRNPEVRQCWWTPEGERIHTGKYEESLFHGQGVTSEEIAMAEELSLNIPAPFLRIDFLRGEDGLVFGEFTPKPGNYEEFDQPTDQLLGDYFLHAETRLIDDLLQGKEFQLYKQLVTETIVIKG